MQIIPIQANDINDAYKKMIKIYPKRGAVVRCKEAKNL